MPALGSICRDDLAAEIAGFRAATPSAGAEIGSAGARLLPAPLPLPHALQRTPARLRAEPLQRASPLLHEPFVAARPVAAMLEKNS